MLLLKHYDLCICNIGCGGQLGEEKIAEYPSGLLMAPPATQRAEASPLPFTGRENKKPQAALNRSWQQRERLGGPPGRLGVGSSERGVGRGGAPLAWTRTGHSDRPVPYLDL